MERSRDARRGPIAAVNGGGGAGLSRRRPRNPSRDSPDEDDGLEMPETSRLRDRGVGGGEKKYRDGDRDRSGRSKRRRGERMPHVGSNRDDVDDSSEDSLDDEDEDDDDDLTVRKALPSHPPAANPSSSPSSQQQQNHQNHYHHHHHQQQHSQLQQQQQRKSFPPKAVRPPVAWKADEMIGVAVPRKARSASVKRSHECSVSGGGGVGGEEQIPRQASSPSRLSPASATQISPSSSNASIRKKMKQMSGNKHRPPKMSKASSSSVTQDDIEMEVAEVLFGLTRQQYCQPKQETNKVDTRELNSTSGNETRSRVSSPSSISPSPASLQSVLPPSSSSFNPSMPTVAPKRKKPRPVKFDDESPTSSIAGRAVLNPPMTSGLKLEAENVVKTETPSPRSEQNSASRVVENGDPGVPKLAVPQIAVAQADSQLEAAQVDRNQNPTGGLSTREGIDCTEEAASASKSTLCTDDNVGDSTSSKQPVADSPRKEKFNIDLMAPPPGKLSPDMEDGSNFDSDQKQPPDTEMGLNARIEKEDQEMPQADQSASKVGDSVDKSVRKDMESRKQMTKEQPPNLRMDLEKSHKDDSSGKLQIQKQPQKAPKVEPAQDKSAATTALNIPMAVGAWPGGFPPFGYMGQVPSLQGVIPMDGAAVPSSALQPPAFIAHQSRQKRCATHFYIAQTIHNYQKLARMNPFWSPANANPIYGAKPYNLNAMPPSDAALFSNPMQGNFSARHMGSLHEAKSNAAGAAAYSGYPSSDKMPTTNNPMIEVAQRKQVVLQQIPHTGSTTNMLHGPAFIFPINQQQAASDKAPAAKSTSGFGNVVAPAGASSSTAGSSGSSGALTPMNLSFTGLSTGDAQYLAMFQNNPYPFSLPPHVAGASPFRGATSAQAMPYFFPPHILHPSQIQPPPLQQQPQQQQAGSSQTPHSQPNHQKPSTSSGSSSSQKHPQPSHLISGLGVASMNPHGYPASGQRQHLQPPQHARQQDVHKGSEENPSSSDGRVSSNAQKGMYGQAFSIPVHHHNFSLTSSATASAVVGNAGGHTHSDKQPLSQQPPQKQNVKIDLTSPPAFTMPFTSFNGAGAVLPGLDFSAMSQNHTIFQTHPEAARHGYHQIPMASQVGQNKKQTTDDGKSVARDSMNGTVVAEDERKTMSGSKTTGSGMQHSLSFSKHGGETGTPVSSIVNSSAAESSSRTLNLIQAPANGSRSTNRPLVGAVTNSSLAMGTSNIPVSNQQQQQMLQLHKQQQQQQQLSSSRAKISVSNNSSSAHPDHLAGSSAAAKFPQSLTGYHQTVLQDGNLPPPQIKTTSGRVSTPITTSSSASPIVKSNHLIQQQVRSSVPITASSSASPIVKSNHLSQQQVRSAQQPLSAQSHQTQISFAINPLKMVPAAGQHFSGVSGNSSAGPGAVAVGSPSNSVSKSAGGSPKPAPASVGHPPQSSSKTSSSASKNSPVGNMPSILGHPQNSSAGNSSTKLQQHQLQAQKQQPFPQAQFYFTNAYMQQPHPIQSNAATAGTASGYYQKRQVDHSTQQAQQHQHTSVPPGSSGMLVLSSPAQALSGTSTSDPAKAIAAAAATNVSNIKVMAPNNLHPSQFAVAQSVSGSPHALVPATFPYMSMPAMSVKVTADQKPAAGSDNLVSWQSEKR